MNNLRILYGPGNPLAFAQPSLHPGTYLHPGNLQVPGLKTGSK